MNVKFFSNYHQEGKYLKKMDCFIERSNTVTKVNCT